MPVTRRLLSPALLVVLAMAWAAAVPAPAEAHAELVSSDPAANASLAESPRTVSLTFSEAIDPVASRITLLDTNQHPVEGVGPLTQPEGGISARLTVPELEPGVYTVDYQVTSAVDGHVTNGIFAFLVDPTGSQPPPTSSTQSTSPSSDPEVVAMRWLGLAGLLLAFGTILFWLASARPALRSEHRRTPWGFIAIASAVAVAGQTFYLALAARPLVAAAAASHGGGHAIGHQTFPLDPAAPFGWTPFAIAMRIALAGAALAFILATAHFFRSDERRRRGVADVGHSDGTWLVAVGVAAGIGLLGMSLAGHAAAIGGLLFAAVDWIHLVAVAAWLGTVPGLLLLAARLRRGATPGDAWIGAALRRHSRMAVVAAPVVALTGLANSPLVLGEDRELLASGYGDLLLAKVALFSIAVGIGAVNFFLVRSGGFRRTLALVGGEVIIGALALLAAAGMVTGQPGANRAPSVASAPIGSTHLYGNAGDSSVHVAVNLPAPGNQRYQVSVANLQTGAYRTDVQRVFLEFSPPRHSDLPDERITLDRGSDPWIWSANGAYTPVVGDWRLGVVVRRVGELDETATFDLAVRQPTPPETLPPPDTGVGVPVLLSAAWLWLPSSAMAWLIPLTLFALAFVIGLLARILATGDVEQGATRRQRVLSWTRTAVVVLAVLSGLLVGSRALAEAANHAPGPIAGELNPIQATDDSIARGEELFLANCAACHGVDGGGRGPSVTAGYPQPPSLASVVPRLSDGAISYRIAVGTVGTRMPAFAATLSPNDRWDLVNYLRSRWDSKR